ncbi:nucleotide-diphospho-sugar transferase [Xylariomycetidae sp. FL2044]|nr:nucleotide-diphospho-sugar transferase [Xylariomycetidae sp. FL2044]
MTSAPEPPKNYAYATLITRASYLAGVIVLAHSLQKHIASYPLIVLYTPALPAHALRALKIEAGRSQGRVVLRPCDPLLPPAHVKINLIAARFEDTWTKLRVFERCCDYDAVCYLDADMAAFRTPDAVFGSTGHGGLARLPRGWIGANQSCVCNQDRDPWAPADWTAANCAYSASSHPAALTEPVQPRRDSPRTHRTINGGMFLFRPSRALWEDMMAFFEGNAALLGTFKFPDQEFIAHYFADRWMALGWRYNALKTMRYWHENIWRDDEVVCLHYIVDKPWTKRVGEDGVAGYKGRDGVTHGWWWDEYEDWERARLADGAPGSEVVGLVRKGVAPPLGSTGRWADGEQDPGMAAIGSDVQGFANNKLASEAEATVTIKAG